MTDSSCLLKLISTIQPTEVYHLAAQVRVAMKLTLRHLQTFIVIKVVLKQTIVYFQVAVFH